MDEPVYAFIENENEGLNTDNADDDDDDVIYLTFKDDSTVDEDNGDTATYLVQNGSVLAPSPLLRSDLKVLTINGEQYFYIPMEDNENEDTQTSGLEPLLEDDDTGSLTLHEEQSNDDLKESYKMIGQQKGKESSSRFICLYKGCEKVFATSQLLRVHMQYHVSSKPFLCVYMGCGKRFATNYSLTAHWRTHTGEKPYNCNYCLKSFKTSGDLMKHVRIHTGEKPFVCPIEGCGKSFTTSNIRKVHVRSHTGERPYVCDYPNCGKAFASSTNYKNHARIHSGEKPYACNVMGCVKKFTEYSSLYKHQAVHKVEKPHQCAYCRHKFKSEHTLNVHQKVKHAVLLIE